MEDHPRRAVPLLVPLRVLRPERLRLRARLVRPARRRERAPARSKLPAMRSEALYVSNTSSRLRCRSATIAWLRGTARDVRRLHSIRVETYSSRFAAAVGLEAPAADRPRAGADPRQVRVAPVRVSVEPVQRPWRAAPAGAVSSGSRLWPSNAPAPCAVARAARRRRLPEDRRREVERDDGRHTTRRARAASRAASRRRAACGCRRRRAGLWPLSRPLSPIDGGRVGAPLSLRKMVSVSPHAPA